MADALSSRPSWRRLLNAGMNRLVRHSGIHPERFGYRWVPRETPGRHVSRTGRGSYTVVEPAGRRPAALPRNIAEREALPRERRAWGLSLHDVPDRAVPPTYIATVPGARIATWTARGRNNRYFAVLTSDGRRLSFPGETFRPAHAGIFTSDRPIRRIRRASWVLQPSYMNFSIWLRAHLPKVLLLQEHGLADDILLPPDDGMFPGRSSHVQGHHPYRDMIVPTLRRLGLEPERMQHHDAGAILEVDELTVVGMDVFPVRWLARQREAFRPSDAVNPERRIYISRARSRGRRLHDEDAVWPVLRDRGFEYVLMEELTLDAQVRLMAEARVVFGTHGAGLTNTLFCPAGAHVIEVLDPEFPCPNFYGLSAATSHPYWLLWGEPVGAAPAPWRPLALDPGRLSRLLDRLEREDDAASPARPLAP